MSKVYILLISLLVFLPGCATLDILDALFTDTTTIPICDSDSIGTIWEKKVCLKYSDGSYSWTKIPEKRSK